MKKIDRKPVIIVSTILVLILVVSIVLFYVNYGNALSANPNEYAKITCFSFWWYLLNFDLFGYVFYLSPLFIPIITCYCFYKVYRSGYVSNVVLRCDYDKFIRSQIFYSWGKNIIIPIILLVFFVVSMILFPNFDFHYTGGVIFSCGHEYFSKINPYLFIMLYLLLLFLYGVLVTNIGIILSRYIKKFSLLIVGIFIVFMIMESICNFLIAPFASLFIKNSSIVNGFSLLNVYYLNGIPSLWWEFLWLSILNVISTVCIYKIYSKKEKVLNVYE